MAAAKVPEERWKNRDAYKPSHNVAPGYYTPVIKRDKAQELEVHTMKYADCYASFVPARTLACKRAISLSCCLLHTLTAFGALRWGLVPSFTKKDAEKLDHFRMVRTLCSGKRHCDTRLHHQARVLQFNARCETVAEKSVFSRLLQRQRCVVLFDGFYEWKKVRLLALMKASPRSDVVLMS